MGAEEDTEDAVNETLRVWGEHTNQSCTLTTTNTNCVLQPRWFIKLGGGKNLKWAQKEKENKTKMPNWAENDG